MRADFEEALDVAHAVFGARTFQVRDQSGKWKLSFDAVMVGVDALKTKKKALIRNKADITKALQRQLRDDNVYETVVGKPNTANAIKERIAIVGKILVTHT